MIIFLQTGKAIKKLGLIGSSMIKTKQVQKAKKNEYVFCVDSRDRIVRLNRYKKVKHLDINFYAIVDIWGEDTKRILERLKKRRYWFSCLLMLNTS